MTDRITDDRLAEIAAKLRRAAHIPAKEYGNASTFVMETVGTLRRERSEAADIIDALRLERQPTQAIVEGLRAERVKPLEWGDIPSNFLQGWRTAFGREYEVWDDGKTDVVAAKAEAQADYAQRILSALTPVPASLTTARADAIEVAKKQIAKFIRAQQGGFFTSHGWMVYRDDLADFIERALATPEQPGKPGERTTMNTQEDTQ